MSKIAVNEITDEQGSGRPSFTNGVQTSNINGGQVGGRRNLIINGAMQVAQRGTSTSGVTSSGYYACDRWKLDSLTEDTVTISQSTDSPDGFSNSLKLEVTSADSSFDSFDYAAFTHAFEGQDLQNLAFGSASAKSLILSFWVKSTVAGTYAIQLQHQDSNLYYCKTYNINSVNTWENKTITIDGNTQNSFDNDSNRSANLWFIMTAGSGYTGGTEDQWVSNSNSGSLAGGHNVNLSETVGNEFYLTGVQLEVGDTATEFEHRSYGEELTLCQRYYQTFHKSFLAYGGAFELGSASTAFIPIPLLQPMRIDGPTAIGDLRYYDSRFGGSASSIDSFSANNCTLGTALLIYSSSDAPSTTSYIRALREVPDLDAEL